jgi:hypothetical protein
MGIVTPALPAHAPVRRGLEQFYDLWKYRMCRPLLPRLGGPGPSRTPGHRGPRAIADPGPSRAQRRPRLVLQLIRIVRCYRTQHASPHHGTTSIRRILLLILQYRMQHSVQSLFDAPALIVFMIDCAR